MKKSLLTLLVMLSASVSSFAQHTYEHAQTRVQEGVHEFFVRPIVADLKVISETRQEYGPFNIYPGLTFQELTANHVADAKTNAAYKAAVVADADIILGATFYVTLGDSKTKGLNVTVKGYPAKYENFHNFGDPAKGKEDDKWIVPLQNGFQVRQHLNGNVNTQSISTNKK